MSDSGVVITGTTGSIGWATARMFLDSGYTVVGLDATPPTEPIPRRFRPITIDLKDHSRLKRELGTVTSDVEIGHVIAIAGGALPWEPGAQNDPLDIDPNAVIDSLEQNLITQFNTIHATLPLLRSASDIDRSITLTSSINGLSGQGMPAYSAAKAGLIGLMYALVSPLGAEGIRINVVAPGTVRTPRTESIWSQSENHFEHLIETTALGRLGTAEDVGRVYFALATMFSHVTGQVLVVDGGQMAVRR